ncbi:MAG: hypothetical protein ACRD8W_00475 [Nitrososphaeraceae archaeon]
MPKLSLRPFAHIEEGLDAYLNANFTRLENVFEKMPDVETGVSIITGLGTVVTPLGRVDGVIAMLNVDASSAAAFVRAAPGVSAGTIDIRVLTSAFAVSITAVSVRFIAVGELILS